MPKIRKKQGFTLIELALSLIFIGILSLTVAYIINDTIGSYRKGVVLKQINTMGMALIDDMRATIQDSSKWSVKKGCDDLSTASARSNCNNDGAKKFVTITKKAKVYYSSSGKSLGKNDEPIPVYGAFCTGNYSYIWNSGYYYNSMYKVENGVNKSLLTIGSDKIQNFRLLKVKDSSRMVCRTAAGNDYNENNFSGSFTVESSDEKAIDLLNSSEQDGGLVLYDLDVATPAENMAKNNLFYSVSFILGTLQGDANIGKTGGDCATPGDYEVENFDYCAINKFNFAVQAAGGRKQQ